MSRPSTRHVRVAPRRAVLALAAVLPGAPALAQEAAPAPVAADVPGSGGEEPGGWLERDALLGDIGGLRPTLAATGVEAEVALVLDATKVVRGGAERDESLRGLLDLALSFDLGTLAGLEGGLAFLDAYSIFGEQDAGVGNVQGVSSIVGEEREQIAELWWEQLLLDHTLRVKVGKVDANTEFAWVEHGAEFVGPAWAISPNVLAIPTYPETAVSLNVFWTPDDASWLGIGVYDGAAQAGRRPGLHGLGTAFGAPSDLWIVAEGGRTWHDGRLGVGAWRATGEFAEFDGGTDDGTHGFYAVLDQALTSEVAADGESVNGAGLFARVALADADVSAVTLHVAAGVQWSGLIAARPDDVCGCGCSVVELSDEAGFGEDREVVLECFWRYQATPWVALKPDVQVVLAPGGDPALDDALVLGLRVEATF